MHSGFALIVCCGTVSLQAVKRFKHNHSALFVAFFLLLCVFDRTLTPLSSLAQRPGSNRSTSSSSMRRVWSFCKILFSFSSILSFFNSFSSFSRCENLIMFNLTFFRCATLAKLKTIYSRLFHILSLFLCRFVFQHIHACVYVFCPCPVAIEYDSERNVTNMRWMLSHWHSWTNRISSMTEFMCGDLFRGSTSRCELSRTTSTWFQLWLPLFLYFHHAFCIFQKRREEPSAQKHTTILCLHAFCVDNISRFEWCETTVTKNEHEKWKKRKKNEIHWLYINYIRLRCKMTKFGDDEKWGTLALCALAWANFISEKCVRLSYATLRNVNVHWMQYELGCYCPNKFMSFIPIVGIIKYWFFRWLCFTFYFDFGVKLKSFNFRLMSKLTVVFVSVTISISLLFFEVFSQNDTTHCLSAIDD